MFAFLVFMFSFPVLPVNAENCTTKNCNSDADCRCPDSSCIDVDMDSYVDDYIDYPPYGRCVDNCSCSNMTAGFCMPILTYNDYEHCRCVPKVVLNSTWSSCNTKNMQYKNYYDMNNCSIAVPESLNQSCDYCMPRWVGVKTACQANNMLTEFYVDVNDCYQKTGLGSDIAGKPQSVNYSCDYCVPRWSCIVRGDCLQSDIRKCDSVEDENDCYAATGLSSDIYNSDFSEFETAYCDYNDDGLIGNASSIKTEMDNVKIVYYDGFLKIKSSNKTVLELWFNPLKEKLNLFNVKIEKQDEFDKKGYIIIDGIDLDEFNKTVYLDHVNNNANRLCIVDSEIDDIDDISNSCNEGGEVSLECNGSLNLKGYKCVLDSSFYKIHGLRHSAAVEYVYEADEELNSTVAAETSNTTINETAGQTQDNVLSENKPPLFEFGAKENIQNIPAITGNVVLEHNSKVSKGGERLIAFLIVVVSLSVYFYSARKKRAAEGKKYGRKKEQGKRGVKKVFKVVTRKISKKPEETEAEDEEEKESKNTTGDTAGYSFYDIK